MSCCRNPTFEISHCFFNFRRFKDLGVSFNCVVYMSTHSLFHVDSSSSSVHEELLLSLLLVVRSSTGVVVCSTE